MAARREAIAATMPSSLSISPPRETSRTKTCAGRSLESRSTEVACSADGQQQSVDSSSSLDEPARVEVTQEDLESVAVILGRITDLSQDHLRPQHDEKVVTLLDAHVQAVIGTMKKRLSASKEIPLQDAEVLRAKQDLYDICFRELVSTTNAINPGLSQVLEALRDAHSALVQEVPGIVRRAIHQNAEAISRLEEERERGSRETADLLEASRALEREATRYSREIGVLQCSQRKLERENVSLRKMLERRSSSVHRTQHARFTTEPGIADINSTKTSSDTRGRSMTTTTLCGTDREERRDTPDTSLAEVSSLANGKERGGSGATHEARENKKEAEREMSLKHLKDFICSVYASKEKYDKQCDVQRLPKQTLWEHLDDFIVHRYGLKPIAKAQAEAMWTAVKKYRGVDNAVTVFELTLRNEVEEDFHREQKKLEQVVVDFLRSGIRKRATARRNVAVAFPRGVGNGGASPAVTDFFLRNQTRPDAPLSATDWQSVICHVYQGSVADAQTVSVLVKKDISNRRPKGLVGQQKHNQHQHRCLVTGEGEGLWSSSVPFGVFLQILLGYQLDIHLRSLKQLREDFRKVDIDADGILDPAQFTTLAKRTLLRRAKNRVGSTSSPRRGPPAIDRDPSWAVAPTREDGRRRDGDTPRRKNNVDDLAVERLKVADPHGFGRITFSECVKCLAPRPISAGFADG